jgi:Protein of unknown function (DUF736)
VSHAYGQRGAWQGVQPKLGLGNTTSVSCLVGDTTPSNLLATGEIVTLSVQAKNVRIVPETTRSGDNSPSHRVYVGRVEHCHAYELATRCFRQWRRSRRLTPNESPSAAAGSPQLDRLSLIGLKQAFDEAKKLGIPVWKVGGA